MKWEYKQKIKIISEQAWVFSCREQVEINSDPGCFLTSPQIIYNWFYSQRHDVMNSIYDVRWTKRPPSTTISKEAKSRNDCITGNIQRTWIKFQHFPFAYGHKHMVSQHAGMVHPHIPNMLQYASAYAQALPAFNVINVILIYEVLSLIWDQQQ